MNHLVRPSISGVQNFSFLLKENVVANSNKSLTLRVAAIALVIIALFCYKACKFFFSGSSRFPNKPPPPLINLTPLINLPPIIPPIINNPFGTHSTNGSNSNTNSTFRPSSPNNFSGSSVKPEDLSISASTSQIVASRENIYIEEQILKMLEDNVKDHKVDDKKLEISKLKNQALVEEQILSNLENVDTKDDKQIDEKKLEIAKLKNQIETEEQVLFVMENDIQLFEDKKLEIKQLKDQVHKDLATYPSCFFKDLKGKFQSYPRGNPHEIQNDLVEFEGIMGTYAEYPDFIIDCLTKIDTFLSETFFTSTDQLCLDETEKFNLIVFHPFFTIVNKFADTIETDEQLTNRLKTKLANLPLGPETDRCASFPNVYLTESNQLKLLIDHFQAEQDHYLEKVIKNLSSNGICSEDFKKLAKLVVKDPHSTTKSYSQMMTDGNITKLRNCLQRQRSSPINWNSQKDIENALPGSTGWSCQELTNLYRASRAWAFFQSQDGLSDDSIQIPRWYHATSYSSAIIESGKIEVRHQQAFNGAWVSNQRESSFGPSTLAFNNRLTKLDNGEVFIGYEQGKTNWRGIQVEIPLVDPKTCIPNLSFVALYKGAQKTEKLDVLKKLKSKKINKPVLVSIEQLDYIQKEIIKIIGNPNRPDKWWGKEDVENKKYK